ncbi:MAG: glycosyltransferase [Hyphomicrobium sp.]|jgi:glycosyltransferase involved in cell wall biosynthesis
MTDPSEINSNGYWDRRFHEDWEQRSGPSQSRFFARLAADSLPPWLFQEIKRRKLSVADWGCAQGDGTDLLAGYIDRSLLSGIDFSAVAIEQAAQRYPALRFLHENWLQEDEMTLKTSYDIVFSSNTLEHFHLPYDVLEKLSYRANKAVVLALPYREIERHHEHFFTFLPGNIPLELANGFRLAWSQVVDCRNKPFALWAGDQIFLVYAAPDWLTELRPTLADCRIEETDHNSELAAIALQLAHENESGAALQAALAAAKDESAALAAELDGIKQQLGAEQQATQAIAVERDDLKAALGAAKVQIASLNSRWVQTDFERNQWEFQAKAMASSTSWKVTGPLRLVSTAARLLASDPKATGKRMSHLVDLVRRDGIRAAVAWTRNRLSLDLAMRPLVPARTVVSGSTVGAVLVPAPSVSAQALLPAFALIEQPFDPYQLIEPIKPIRVDVIDETFRGTVLPFSCVTTVRNEGASIVDLLVSLAKQSALPRELILVDGGSTDDTIELVRRWSVGAPFEVKLIEAGKVNIARGRNIGTEQVSTDIIVFIDAGSVLKPSFCRELVGAFSTYPHLDAAGGLYEASVTNANSKQFVWDFDTVDLTTFLPSARALAVQLATFRKTNGFPEYLTKTGEDTLFAVQLRQASKHWAVCRRAWTVWESPADAEPAERLTYSYASGDGESGFGDFKAYSLVLARDARNTWLPQAWIDGYLTGRGQRALVEVERRGVAQLVVILSGVPFTDSGGGQRCSQLAMALARRNRKVVFVNIYPSFEERKKVYFDADLSLFEFYALRDFDADELAGRYDGFETIRLLIIAEFPHPSLLPVIEILNARFKGRTTTVYDYIDNWQTSLGWEWYSEAIEERFIRKSDLLVASARTLRDRLAERSGRDVALIANAVNDQLFDRRLDLGRPTDLPNGRKIVLYTGAMWGDWFDWELMRSCASSLPEFDFVLIGGVDPARQAEVSQALQNVHFLGLKPQRDLPAYLLHSDVGIIPFIPGDVTNFVNPLKVYEYVAMALPVVATQMIELAGIPGVTIATTTGEFIEALKRRSSEEAPVKDMDRFTKLNNWDSRIDHLLRL